MGESGPDNRRPAQGQRAALEALGRRLRDVLIQDGFVFPGEPRPADDLWEIGRLMRAFVRVDDAGVRTEVIALVEALGLPPPNGDPLPRR